VEVRGRKLHFGVQLQAQRTDWAGYARAVRAVEELGFGSVWTFDHMLPFAGPDDGSCFETLTTMGALALLTERVRIGALVNGVLYRDPATLAKAAAQVDRMTGGRLDFSLGAAWAEREFRAYGLGFPSLAERYGRLEEALEVVTALWSAPRTTLSGRYYRLDDAPCEPKPVQVPLPVTVGGSGLGSLRVAARFAHRLNLIGGPGYCAQRWARFGQLCAERGRDAAEVELSVHPVLAVAATGAGAHELASRLGASNSGQPGEPGEGWLTGTPDAVVAQIRRYTDIGVSHFVFALPPPFELAHLRLFVQEVAPAFQ
jgi:alkanesulfonate monooxygenase SsuD/methylene tetrahydromethanopterin reductase-like flavin-dependent oxidoreductase (luciferase family)